MDRPHGDHPLGQMLLEINAALTLLAREYHSGINVCISIVSAPSEVTYDIISSDKILTPFVETAYPAFFSDGRTPSSNPNLIAPLREQIRAALKSASVSQSRGDEFMVFSGMLPCAGYESALVLSAIHLPSIVRLDASRVPSSCSSKVEDALPRSLFESCIVEYLKRVEINHGTKTSPMCMLPAIHEIIQDCGVHLADWCSLIAGTEFLSKNYHQRHGVFHWIDAISKRTYESHEASGRIHFISRGIGRTLTDKVLFDSAVDIADAPLVRKLLELTPPTDRTEEWGLLCDGHWIYGLGQVGDMYVDSSVFIAFKHRSFWELRSHNKNGVIMKVSHGDVTFPSHRFDIAAFRTNLVRLFPCLTGDQIVNLVKLAAIMGELSHGGILAICANAKDEAIRLGNLATRIEPVLLTADMLIRMARVDGAILVDTNCHCVGFGVILDGAARPLSVGNGLFEQRSRGARYNSTLRYIFDGADSPDKHPRMAVLASDDGMVNIIPNLPAPIPSSRLRDIISEFEAACSGPSSDEFLLAFSKLVGHEFFLKADDCARMTAMAAEAASRFQLHWLKPRLPLRPNRDMNDGFLLSDESPA